MPVVGINNHHGLPTVLSNQHSLNPWLFFIFTILTRKQKREANKALHQVEQMRRGALRLDKDSLGRSNINKRGPKSIDEGCTGVKYVTPEQLAFRDLVLLGYSAEDARREARLPQLR